MILTCPNCNSKFNLDKKLLGVQGHKVRCSSCQHVWFQENEDGVGGLGEDLAHEEVEQEEDFDSVLSEIESEIEEEGLSSSSEDDVEEEAIDVEHDDEEGGNKEDDDSEGKQSPFLSSAQKSSGNKTASFAVVGVVFILSFIYLLIGSSSIMRAHPSMQSFYAFLGIQMDIPGKGLTFEKVVVEDDGEVIKVRGNIINLEAVDNHVPIIEASLLGENDSELLQWYISPSKNNLQAEESVSFDSAYYRDKTNGDAEKQEHLNVRLRFALFSKIDGEDGENSQVPHQDVPDPQNDHAESSKSHQSSSSVLHQEPSHQSRENSH